jgi:hypothetical protein
MFSEQKNRSFGTICQLPVPRNSRLSAYGVQGPKKDSFYESVVHEVLKKFIRYEETEICFKICQTYHKQK